MLTFDTELVPYDKTRYENIRRALKDGLLSAESDKELVANYNSSIHLSYCVQNLHKNFNNRLKDLSAFYSRHKKMPAEMYFEPSLPKVFPPPPKTDDDLPVLPKILIHHAEFYEFKSIPITWKNLVEQYLLCMEYAINTQDILTLNACVKAGSDGCFDNCISEMGVWKGEQDSVNESAKRIKPT